MLSRTHRRAASCWCGILVLALAAMIPGRTCAQGKDAHALVDTIFADWKHRQSILQSVRYVLTGTIEYKDSQLPPGNANRPFRCVLLLDLSRKRYRLDQREDRASTNGSDDPAKWEYRSFKNTSAYDGEALQHLRYREENRIERDRADDLSIGKGSLGPGAQFGPELWPIFYAHGIVPTVHSPLLVDKLPQTHDPDDFNVIGGQRLRGQSCLVVRVDPLPTNAPSGDGSLSDEFWINPGQRSAIHRHVYFSGSDPYMRFDIFWKNTPYGWWVDHWAKTYSVNGRVRRIHHLRVESFTANPEVSESDFKLPAEPGMVVTVSEAPPPGKGLNPFLAATRTYRVSPSGSWEEIAARGFTTREGKELPPERRWGWITWALGGAAAMAAFLVYMLRRRRKMSAQ